MCPWDALPPHLNTPEAWKGTDWDKNFLQRWLLKYKGWFAFGPRANEDWACWREWPITLLALRGKGSWRLEDDTEDFRRRLTKGIRWAVWEGCYLSRIQKWAAWSIQIQWPLFVAIHFYIGKTLVFFYIGAHRDSDKVYWIPSIFLGTVWK